MSSVQIEIKDRYLQRPFCGKHIGGDTATKIRKLLELLKRNRRKSLRKLYVTSIN